MNNKEYDLTPIRKEIYRVYKCFVDICRKNKLRYTLAYGTVLGAVRHNGFIPWDDDFDVHMPRPDYEKFKIIANQQLPEEYLLVSSENCDGYRATFSKVYFVDRHRVEEIEKESNLTCSQGIFIDVFPVDGVPMRIADNIVFQIGAIMVASLYRFLYRKKCSRIVGKISYAIGWLVHKCHKDIKSFAEFNAWYYSFTAPFEASSRCGRFHEAFGKYTWILPTESLVHPSYVTFEGELAPVPADYDSYLRQNYGEYMKLPPEADQEPMHSRELPSPWRFGDGVSPR